MSEKTETPDTFEKYQAHAYRALVFACDCGAFLELPLNHRQFSRPYFEQMAEDAKKAGWTVPELNCLDTIPEMIAFCPACSKTRNET